MLKLTYRKKLADEALRSYTATRQAMRSSAEGDETDGYQISVKSSLHCKNLILHHRLNFFNTEQVTGVHVRKACR